MTDAADGPQATRTGRARLAVGLVQGVVLLVLFDRLKPTPGHELDAWLAALRSAAVFAPVVLLGGLGAVRPRTLAIWTAAAAVIAAATAGYAADTDLSGRLGGRAWQPFVGGTAAALFILHHLVAPADQERRWRADYRRYFDLAWTDAVRLVLSVGFVGALWLLLILGASLFALIGLKQVRDLIMEPWFAFPVTAVAFAAAVHLTDIRASLVRGVRTLTLTLMSWLLPLMALIVTAFLIALPFTGLAPLWSTRSAASVLLAAAAALIILINTAYQDGPREDAPPILLKWAGRIGCIAISPLVVIAFYAVALRIGQYGLTPERISAAVCVLVGAAFAVGYLVAVVSPGAWLKRVELSNFLTAHLAVALLLALMSPLADPRRLSVDDQIRRLDQGRISPAEFDYAFLKFRAGKWGAVALKGLANRRSGPHAAEIAERASQAMAASNPYMPTAPIASERAALAAAVGPGKLPASFVDQDWKTPRDPLSGCAAPKGEIDPALRCAAVVADVDGDGVDEVVWLQGRTLSVYKLVDDRWTSVSSEFGALCEGDLAAAAQGRFQVSPPDKPWKELDVGGRRIPLKPKGACRDEKPVAKSADDTVVEVEIVKPDSPPKAEP